MSNTKTEAQRLADALEKDKWHVTAVTLSLASDELRRLDAENSDLRERNAALGNAQEIALDTATEHALAADELRGALATAEAERGQIKKQAASVRSHLVDSLAFALCEKDGNDDPHHLIWDGQPENGPWGEVWQKYLPDAEALAETAFKSATDFGLAFDEAEAKALEDAIAERDQLRAQVERLQSQPAAWECFSDPSYFDMWAVKQIGNTRFDAAYHVTSEVEARRLCAMLNSIETRKQSFQVEPAVNQQLTTEPFDEREAFEREMIRRKSWTVYDFQPHPRRGEYPHPDYLTPHVNTAWAGWKARAAMAQVSDINVVESFTNDTKDAERYRWLRDDTDSDWAICEWSHDPGDEGYYRDARAPHIVDAAIDAAMAKGVK